MGGSAWEALHGSTLKGILDNVDKARLYNRMDEA